MLEYSKIILQKVSFDKLLFSKELRKALLHLSLHEQTDLKNWCNQHFQNRYPEVLQERFASLSPRGEETISRMPKRIRNR